jgi:hypothetical protein
MRPVAFDVTENCSLWRVKIKLKYFRFFEPLVTKTTCNVLIWKFGTIPAVKKNIMDVNNGTNLL